ncbi:hypothetical protein N9Y07_03820 [Alphaproteobacteria bacterium]|nr:hypothetical protein [Alphaproteobacteria bacterium]
MDVISFFLHLIVGLSSCYFFLRNKTDLLLLFFLSSILYHWQIIFGQIWVPPFSFPASEESKLILSTILITQLFWAFLVDRIRFKRVLGPRSMVMPLITLDSITILLVISYISSLTVIYLVPDIWTINKTQYRSVLSDIFPYDFFIYYPASIALLLGLFYRKYLFVVLSLLPLLLNLFLGQRTSIVLAFIGAVMILTCGVRLRSMKSLLFALAILACWSSMVVVKFSSSHIKQGGWSDFQSYIASDKRFGAESDFWAFAFGSAEFGQISSNLSLSTVTDQSPDTSFVEVFWSSFPFVKTILDMDNDEVRFSTFIERFANPGFSYGLGGTIWGEMFSYGGIFGVWIFCLVCLLVLTFLSLSICAGISWSPYLIFFGSFVGFYIHRCDLILVFGHIKNTVLFCAVGFLWHVHYRIIILFLRNQQNSGSS